MPLQVLDLGDQRPSASITGLEYHRVPGTERYLALVAAAGRLYQYSATLTGGSDSRPLLTTLFTAQGEILAPLHWPGGYGEQFSPHR